MFWDPRKEEERFEFKTKPAHAEKPTRQPEIRPSPSIPSIERISKQIDTLARYLALLSRKVDQALEHVSEQEAKLKDMRSQLNKMTPDLDRMSKKAIFSIEEES